jgi:hypothetical protein
LCPKYAKIHPHEYVIFKNFPGSNPGWTPVNKRKGRSNRGGTEVKGVEEEGASTRLIQYAESV